MTVTAAATLSAPPATTLREHLRFTRPEKRRVGIMYLVVVLLHVGGFGLYAYYSGQSDLGGAGAAAALAYSGAAGAAYALGLRHAFDADHIAAIDDTTRFLLAKGRKPLGVGLAFSLGHSTIVFALSVGIAFATQAAIQFREGFADTGGLIGTLVSSGFLFLLGTLNLIVLIGIVKTWRAAKRGTYRPEELEALLAQRGLMNRLFRGRYDRMINHTWQLYFVGLLFGLGFDTATQVGAIGLAAGAAAGGGLPPLAIIALPLCFAAGMTLMDTTDGIFMSKAYDWAFTQPLRKIYYNITTTGLSIFIAFVIGGLQVSVLLADRFGFDDVQPFAFFTGIDLGIIGVGVVLTFLFTWIGAVLLWKHRGYDERYAHLATPTARAD